MTLILWAAAERKIFQPGAYRRSRAMMMGQPIESPDSALRYRFNDQRFELYAPGYYGTFRFASDRATLPEVPHMLSSFRYIVPIGTVPPPTPACETHTASVQVQPNPVHDYLGYLYATRS